MKQLHGNLEHDGSYSGSGLGEWGGQDARHRLDTVTVSWERCC